jgi:hypothetical protein
LIFSNETWALAFHKSNEHENKREMERTKAIENFEELFMDEDSKVVFYIACFWAFQIGTQTLTLS